MPDRPSASPIVIILAGAVFLTAAALAFTPIESHDLWWHLYTGREILRTGWPPATNSFSHTAPDFLWVTHEWLSEVVFYWVYSRLGPAALVALKPLLVGGAFALTYRTAWRESGSPWSAAAAALLGAWAAHFTFDIRPQILTFLCLAVCLAAIYHHRREGGPMIYALVPLFWIWANLHSGYIVGLILLAVAAATTPGRRRAFVSVLLLGLAMALLTPNGWRTIWFPIAMSRYALMLNTLTEWYSPDFHAAWTRGFEVMLLGTIASLALSGRRASAFELVLFFLFAHSALRHQRHIALFSLMLAPLFARHLALAAAPLKKWVEALPGLDLGAAFGILAFSLVLLLGGGSSKGLLAKTTCLSTFPQSAADYLDRQPRMRLFNLYRWGGYLIWRLHPRQQVFIDGRCDAYPEQVFADYLKVERLQPGWRDVLDRYHVQAVVYVTGSALCEELRREPGWRLTHSDGLADVFVRGNLPTVP